FYSYVVLRDLLSFPTRRSSDLMGAWSIVLALSGTYAQLLDYVVFGDWIFFGLTVVSLFIYRARDLTRGEVGFRVPGYPWTPALRSEEHTSELQSQSNLVCRLLL